MAAPETKNKAMLGAYRRGAEAFRAGKAMRDCPYKIAPLGCHRRNGGTWGAVFKRYWEAGYWDAKSLAS